MSIDGIQLVKVIISLRGGLSWHAQGQDLGTYSAITPRNPLRVVTLRPSFSRM